MARSNLLLFDNCGLVFSRAPVAETAQRVFREAAYHSGRLHGAPSPIVLRGRPVARSQARGQADIRA